MLEFWTSRGPARAFGLPLQDSSGYVLFWPCGTVIRQYKKNETPARAQPGSL